MIFMRKYVYFVLLCSLASCKGNVLSNLNPIKGSYSTVSLQLPDSIADLQVQDIPTTIQIPEEQEELNVHDLCPNVTYVPLETRPECLLGNIDKIKADSSYIFVLDKRNSLLCAFRKDGTFHKKYGSIGHGPGEFVSITDFSLDLSKHVVTILDLGGGKLITYAYDGNYLSEQPLFYYYNQFECSDHCWPLSTSFAHNSMSPQLDLHRLILSDNSQVPYSRAFPFSDRLRKDFHQESKIVFQKTSDNSIYYNYIPSNVIYEFSDTTCVARYRITSQAHGQDWDKLVEQLNTDELFDAYVKQNRYFSSIYLINRNFLVCYIFNPTPSVSMLLFDRKTMHQKYGTLYYGNRSSLTNKLLASHFDFALYDNTFVNFIQPFDVFKIIDEHKRFQMPLIIDKKEQELLSKIDSESNPVLMLFSFQSF